MNWFFLALIPPALWAASNHIDKFLISRYLKGGGTGVLALFSALAGLFALPILLAFHPSSWSVAWFSILLLAASGFVGLFGLILYFWSMQKEDASVVIPLFQLTPIFSYTLGYLILGESLSLRQFLAGAIILIGAVIISLDLDSKIRLKSNVLFLMLASCLFFAVTGVLFKKVALVEGFWPAVFWDYAGMGIAGLTLLATIRSYRNDFINILRLNKARIIAINLGNEAINITAVLANNFVLMLAPVVIVSLVGSFQPVFVFVFGIVLTLFFPHINSESLAKKHLAQRILAIAIILFGSYLLNK